MKKTLIFCTVMVLLGTMCFVVVPKEVAGKEELKALNYLRKGHKTGLGYEMYLKRLNEKAKGELTVKLIGGPEAIPVDAQVEAVRSGVVDVYAAGTGRFKALVPECFTLELSEITPSEERKVGYYDFLNKLFNKAGLVYIGRTWMNFPFHLFSNVKVKKLDDLAGLKFRGTAFYHPIMKPLGIIPVAMPIGDIYEAMNRGLVDGWAASLNTALSRKLYEVTKYSIDHGFWGAGNFIVVANLKTWNGLPKRHQELMVGVLAKMEPELADFWKKAYGDAHKKLEGYGMEFIKLSASDAKRFDDAAVRMKWEGLLKKSPENVGKIKKMITK